MKKPVPLKSGKGRNFTGLALSQAKTTELAGLTDTEIWGMFRQGHEGAFNHIYISHFRALCKYGFSFTDDLEIIKDTIQDLFVELRKSGRKLSDTNNIKFYLFKSLRWKLYRVLKKKTVFIYSPDMSQFFKLEFSLSPESILIKEQSNKESASKISELINTLPKRQKEALYYFYFEDYSYREVADIMNLSNVKSARNLIYKGIKVLRKAFLNRGI